MSRRALLPTVLCLAAGLSSVLVLEPGARADLYKYKKADGTIVYTDNLSQLPPERRDHYTKLREEREAKRRELEKQVGKDEVERREAEAKKTELQRAEMDEQERAQRIQAIEADLVAIRARNKKADGQRDQWAQRMKQAKDRLAKRLADFREASQRYNELAIKPSFTLLPGQAEELEKAKADMERLEGEVDESIEEVEETIPEEARKAGVPPGWLR